MFICLRPRTSYPPPPAYTLYTCIQKGKRGEVEQERRLEGQQSTNLGQNTNQFINSDKHLPQSPFLDDDNLLWCRILLISPCSPPSADDMLQGCSYRMVSCSYTAVFVQHIFLNSAYLTCDTRIAKLELYRDKDYKTKISRCCFFIQKKIFEVFQN